MLHEIQTRNVYVNYTYRVGGSISISAKNKQCKSSSISTHRNSRQLTCEMLCRHPCTLGTFVKQFQQSSDTPTSAHNRPFCLPITAESHSCSIRPWAQEHVPGNDVWEVVSPPPPPSQAKPFTRMTCVNYYECGISVSFEVLSVDTFRPSSRRWPGEKKTGSSSCATVLGKPTRLMDRTH